MHRHTLTWLLLLGAAGSALADGCFIGPRLDDNSRPSSAAQKAVLLRDGPDEILLLQTTYRGPSSRFAWVIPLPAQPTEVFLAEPIFIDGAFSHTNPEQKTTIRGSYTVVAPPRSDEAGGPPGAGGPGGAGGPPGEAPPVTVLQRMSVGDYAATVLAATEAGALQQWLTRNQYALPPEATPVLQTYVQKRWVFVAIKMSRQAAADKPVLNDVAPLGLRFPYPGDRLVFPLTISRVSAPPLSAIMLCIAGERFYKSMTIPQVHPHPRPWRLRYGDYRRLRTRGQTGPRLLCERLGFGLVPWDDVSFRQSDWVHRNQTPWAKQPASRFFALLKPEEMQDLEFAPDPSARPYHLVVSRTGTASFAAFAALHHSPPRRLSVTEPAEFDDIRPDRFRLGRQIKNMRWGWPIAAAGVVLGALAWVWRRRRAAAMVALLLVTSCLFAGGGAYYADGALNANVDKLLTLVEDAAGEFRADTGLNPVTVADLVAATPPAQGLDASGNVLPVHGWHGPYLSALPPDPVGGEGLVLDPLGLRLADCEGFGTRVSVRRDPPKPANRYAMPFWEHVPDQTMAALRPVAEAMAMHPQGWEIWPRGSTTRGWQMWLVNAVAGRVFLVDAHTGIEPLPGRAGFIRAESAVMYTGSGRLLSYFVSCSPAGLKLETPKPLEGFVGGFTPYPDGRILASVQPDNDSDANLYWLNPGQPLGPPLGSARHGAALSTDGRSVYGATWRGSAQADLTLTPLPEGEPKVLRRSISSDPVWPTRYGVVVRDVVVRSRFVRVPTPVEDVSFPRLALVQDNGSAQIISSTRQNIQEALCLPDRVVYWSGHQSSLFATDAVREVHVVTLADRQDRLLLRVRGPFVHLLAYEGGKLTLGCDQFDSLLLVTIEGPHRATLRRGTTDRSPRTLAEYGGRQYTLGPPRLLTFDQVLDLRPFGRKPTK